VPFLLIILIHEIPKEFLQPMKTNILAPVDGKVVVRVYEGEYYKDKRAHIHVT
jgi:hypothetical protein